MTPGAVAFPPMKTAALRRAPAAPLLRLLLAACALVVTGCFGDDIPPIYEIPDDEYVVVYPASEPGLGAWDSTIGHRVSEATTRNLEVNGDFLTVPYAEVIELMYAEPSSARDDKSTEEDEKIGLEARKITPEKLAELTGADWVVVVEITHFQERDPNNINMIRATANAGVKLFKLAKSSNEKKEARERSERERRRDLARARAGLKPTGKSLMDGGKWVAGKDITANFPKDFFGQYGETFLDPIEARKGLIDQLGDVVAKCFYEHEAEKLAGSGN